MAMTKARKRKVLMVVGNCPVPADTRVWAEAVTLRDAGFEVSVISPKGTKRHRESHVCIDGIQIYRYSLPQNDSVCGYILEHTFVLIMTLWLSLVVLARHGFDVIHAA